MFLSMSYRCVASTCERSTNTRRLSITTPLMKRILNKRKLHTQRERNDRIQEVADARTVLASIPQGGLPMAKTVLVVDDNALIRQALCEMFKREADFEVCGEAENGREAIEKAQQLHPDLIVMDLSMPVMNGIEAASILKSLMPTVPLIIFSEYSYVFSEKEARTAGVSALVSKSDHASVLVGKARALLYDIAA